MADDLYSPHWYRIAELHPKLRAHVRVQRQEMRGQPWYLLSDPSDGRHFRLNAGAYRFIGLCDGERNVQTIWQSLVDTVGEGAPTQGEVISLLGRLSDAGMLQTEVSPDVESMFDGQAKRTRKQTLARLNPLFFRVSLMDPTTILRRIQPWLGGLFNRWMLLLWSLVVLTAATGAVMTWNELSAQAVALTQSPRLLLLTWLIYPFVKLVHEFAHALAVRRWGGEVGNMGITLMVLTPVPWVDASAATAFPNRWHRFLVSAAGIKAELFLAGLAFFIWLNAQPGMVHDVALIVMLIGGISTVLFNGNPLLRFDGYFMLCDALGMPNLGSRSAAYWGYLAKRFLLRLEPIPQAIGQGERPWLLLYAPLSYLYRIFISLVILYWVLGVSVLLFGFAALLMTWNLVVKPLRTLLPSIWNAQGSPAQRRRARWLGIGAIATTTGFMAFVPVPHVSIADGVVWLPENAHVRVQTEGFVLQTHALDGARVEAGQSLLTLDDPLLFAERERLRGQWEALHASHYNALQDVAGDAKSLADEMISVQERIRRNQERIDQLSVRAGVGGTLVLPRQQDLPGRFAHRGAELGYILPDGNILVRAVIPQRDAELVRQRLRAAQVWLHETRTSAEALLDQRDMAAAGNRLPSSVLGDRGGGALRTDPADPSRLTVLEPVLLIDLEVPEVPLLRVGARVAVRFDLGQETLLLQVWRRLRQVFLIPTHAV
jgi:putative peptide zinc metalloprotease protein